MANVGGDLLKIARFISICEPELESALFAFVLRLLTFSQFMREVVGVF